jgi:hypothetical protein
MMLHIPPNLLNHAYAGAMSVPLVSSMATHLDIPKIAVTPISVPSSAHLSMFWTMASPIDIRLLLERRPSHAVVPIHQLL